MSVFTLLLVSNHLEKTLRMYIACGWGGIPDGHVWSRNGGQLDGTRETLVTLRVIVLQADLEFDGLEEVSLLLVQRVFEKLLHVRAHSGCEGLSVKAQIVVIGRDLTDCDFGCHDEDSLPEELIRFLW